MRHNRGVRNLAIRIEYGNKPSSYQIVHPLFIRGHVITENPRRDNSVVIRDFLVIEHLRGLSYLTPANNRVDQRDVWFQSFQNPGDLGIYIIRQEIRIYTGIRRQLLLVQRLDHFQGRVCRESKLPVTFHLQQSQVEQFRRMLHGLFTFHALDFQLQR